MSTQMLCRMELTSLKVFPVSFLKSRVGKIMLQWQLTRPVLRSEAETNNHNNQPEWARISEVTRIFGLKRSRLYQLLQSGQIKSVSLRQRGCIRGIRIINCDSVRLFLDSLANKEAK